MIIMDSTETSRELLSNTVITDVETATQYMIHRIPENTTQLLGTELLQPHNSLVDLTSGDFIPVGYSSEDLLTQDLTEEDRNLAAALVAVQLSQQQKQHQHIHDGILPLDTNTTLTTKTLQDHHVMISEKTPGTTLSNGYIQIIGSESVYIEKQPALPKVTPVRYTTAGQEFNSNSTVSEKETKSLLHTKPDDEKRDSDGGESLRNDNRSSKKSLPHKKRISRKLKKNCNSTNKKIVCNLCEQTFNTNDDFAQHEILCQTTITPIHTSIFTCQICSNPFHDQLRFFEHLKSHYEPGASEDSIPKLEKVESIEPERQDSLLSSLLNLTCIVCSKTFRKQKIFEAHMRDVHSSSKNDEEELDEFSEPEDLMEGINVVVEPDPHSEIEDDSKAWYHEDDLQQTEEDLKELEAVDEHVCHLCKEKFSLRPLLLQHLETCRTTTTTEDTEPTPAAAVKKKTAKKKGNLHCTKCDRVFAHRNSLMYHMRGHSGIRPHQCDQCGKSFFASSALKVHLRLHSGDKPYTCRECGKCFRQWGDLKYHMTSIHSDEKQFQCEYCGKEFARKYSLIVHRRIHTGEKNYKCEFCGKTFRASSYLQNHRRIHTGEKPHSCTVCGKPFRVRSDMKRHQKTHTRPFVTAKTTNQATKFSICSTNTTKLEKVDIVEDDENNSAELHIEDDETTEQILGDYDPLSTHSSPIRVPNKNLYLNELFLVTYPSDLRSVATTESSSSSWIHTDP